MGGKSTKGKPLFTTNMDADLMNEVRNCIAAQMGTPFELPLSGFFDRAVRAELLRQQELSNNGAAFPQREGTYLKAGRRFTKNRKGRAGE